MSTQPQMNPGLVPDELKHEPRSKGLTTARKKKPKELAVITECCTGCAGSPACVEYCPVEDCMFWVPDEDHPPFGRIQVDPLLCIGCKKCTSKGPDGAFLDGCPWDAIVMVDTPEVEKEVGVMPYFEQIDRSVLDVVENDCAIKPDRIRGWFVMDEEKERLEVLKAEYARAAGNNFHIIASAEKFVGVAIALMIFGVERGISQNIPAVFVILPVAVAILMTVGLIVGEAVALNAGYLAALEHTINRLLKRPTLIWEDVLSPKMASGRLSHYFVGFLSVIAFGATITFSWGAATMTPRLRVGLYISLSLFFLAFVTDMAMLTKLGKVKKEMYELSLRRLSHPEV